MWTGEEVLRGTQREKSMCKRYKLRKCHIVNVYYHDALLPLNAHVLSYVKAISRNTMLSLSNNMGNGQCTHCIVYK